MFDWITKRMPQGKLQLFRIYALITAMVVPLMRFFLNADHIELPGSRIVLMSMFIAIFGLSFASEYVKKNIEQLFYIAYTILSLGGVFLIYRNKYSVEVMSSVNMAIFMALFLFNKRKPMAIYTSVIGLGIIASAVFSDPTDAKWGFVLLCCIVLLFGNFAVNARIYSTKRMEHRLSNSQEIQKAAIDNNDNAILLVDERGSLVKANNAYFQLWNMPSEWVKQNLVSKSEKHCLSLLKDPSKLEALWSNVEDLRSQSEAVELEFLDGKVVETFWRTLYSGHVHIGRLWFFRDITAEKLSQKLLLETHKRANQLNAYLLDFATRLSVTEQSAQDGYKAIVKETCEILNADRVEIWFLNNEENSMRLIQAFSHAEGFGTREIEIKLDDHPTYLQRLLSTRLLVVSDAREDELDQDFLEGNYTGKAGAFMHAQIRTGGECLGVLAIEQAECGRSWAMEEQSFASSLADLVAISISAQEKLESQKSLASSSALLKAIFDLSETGIIVEDDAHKILNYNGLYLRMWNLTPEFIENNTYEVIVAHLLGQIKNSESYVEGLEKLKIRPGMEYAGIIEFHDGRVIERYSKAIIVEGGRQGRVWFYLDITERKRRETELINRNFELDSFVYRASHDLKAPLNSIMGLIGIIREEQDREAILKYVQMMDKSVKKLDEFIRQLTQFSQDARLTIVRTKLDLQQFIEELLQDLTFMENASRLEVTMDIVQEADFYSDPVRLAIIFNNLLSNAIKYQDLSKPVSKLHIEIRANEQIANCRFSDNGLGIDAEHQEKVFDLFFRASVKASGSGLGLYITHNAIQKLGGSIFVESVYGEGTSFVVDLPSLTESTISA